MTEASEQLSDLARLREERRQQWLARQAEKAPTQAAPTQAAPTQAAATQAAATQAAAEASVAPEPSSSASDAPSAADVPQPPGVEELSRLSLLPMDPLPPELDGEAERMALVRDTLGDLRAQGRLLRQGSVIQVPGGYSFVAAKCQPDEGVIGRGTELFLSGPALPRLARLQLLALVRHGPGVTGDAFFAQYLRPHFRSIFSEEGLCAVAIAGDMPVYAGVRFHAAALDPEVPLGIVDRNTEIFTDLHEADEFARIHVVPFSDTLPRAYNYNVFEDYMMPFLNSNRLRCFALGDTFIQSGVQFKVVAAEPSAGRLRIGRETLIYTEGRLEPTVAELLPPEITRRLSVFPPSLQMMLLQSDAFGNGEIAERIMAHQALQDGAERPGGHGGLGSITPAALNHLTEQRTWSSELRSGLGQEPQCSVCMEDFVDGEEVRLLRCQHVFHTRCIDEWLGRDPHCPLCRASLIHDGSV